MSAVVLIIDGGGRRADEPGIGYRQWTVRNDEVITQLIWISGRGAENGYISDLDNI